MGRGRGRLGGVGGGVGGGMVSACWSWVVRSGDSGSSKVLAPEVTV